MKEKEPKYDFLGNELHVGDSVVFMEVGYRSLATGIIKHLGEKKAIINIIDSKITRTTPKTIQFYNQIVKIQK